jgi:hypothetical protein
MKDVYLKLYPGFPWQKQRSTRRRKYRRKGKSDGKKRKKLLDGLKEKN